MNKNILEDNIKYTNQLISKILRFGILLIICVAIANYFKLFVIDMKYMLFVVGISSIVFSIPTIIYDVYQIHDKLWIQLLVLILLVIISGIMYTVLSYHVVIMFVIPVCMACLYYDTRYPFIIMVITIPVIIISHLAASYLRVVPDDPLIELTHVIRYGMIPRIIQFIGCSLICIAAAGCSHQLINYLLGAQDRQRKVHNILKQIIFEAEQFMGARHLNQTMKQAVYSLKNILKLLGDEQIEEAVFSAGYLIYEPYKNYRVFSDTHLINNDFKNYNPMTPLQFCNEDVDIHYAHQYPEVSLNNDILSLRFYNQGELIAFIFIKCHIKEDIDYMHFIKMFHTNLQKSIENTRLNSDIIDVQKQLIQSLAEICESKSAQTGQHIKRVGEYMKVMAKVQGLDDHMCETLCMAAMLHDVGKLRISDEILEKKGKLTKEEFDEIKKHVSYGKQLLDRCPGEMMAIGKIIAYQHHEKWDGTGYLNLKGEEIDSYAALVAVIDVFDALVSKRSYKEAWDMNDAYNEIISCSGTHFAPWAVDLFKQTYPQLIEILEAYPD